MNRLILFSIICFCLEIIIQETLTFFSRLVYWQFNVTLITHFLENLFFNETPHYLAS